MKIWYDNSQIKQRMSFILKQAEKNRLSKELIIKASIPAFAQKEFNEVSLNDVCRGNNITKGKLYHHFSSKEELYYACINDALVRLYDDMLSFKVKKDGDYSNGFHTYYEDRIDYWMKNPDDLLLIKYALDNFSKKEYMNIKEEHSKVRDAMKIKTMEIIDTSQNLSPKISVDDLYVVMQLVYEKTFMSQIKKIVLCQNQGDMESAYERKQTLLDMYDKLIYIMLHGILA